MNAQEPEIRCRVCRIAGPAQQISMTTTIAGCCPKYSSAFGERIELCPALRTHIDAQYRDLVAFAPVIG